MGHKDTIGAVGSTGHGGHGRPTRQPAPAQGAQGAQGAQEYKNHGQMVSAAARQGIHGQELSRIARGEVSLEDFIAERDAQIREAEAAHNAPAEIQPAPGEAVEVVQQPAQPQGPAPQAQPQTPFEALAVNQQSLDAVALEFFRQTNQHFKNIGAA